MITWDWVWFRSVAIVLGAGIGGTTTGLYIFACIVSVATVFLVDWLYANYSVEGRRFNAIKRHLAKIEYIDYAIKTGFGLPEDEVLIRDFKQIMDRIARHGER